MTKEEKKTYDAARYRQNKTKLLIQTKAWRVRNHEKAKRYQRDWNFQRKYGITADQVDAMFEKQGRICAICKTDKPGGKGWHVDHLHGEKLVRGILCGACNVGLGHFRDSPEILLNAKSYLEATCVST